MKKINYYLLFVVLLFIEICLTNCSTSDSKNDPTPTPSPEPEPTPAFSIIGEWFSDNSSDGVRMYDIMKFEENNTYSEWFGRIIANESNILITKGTYAKEENILKCKYANPVDQTNTTDNYEIKLLDKYTLTCYLKEYSQQEECHRIIDTFKMVVGETRKIQIDDSKFIPTSYKSTDTKVAVVNNGDIQVLKRGTAYISVTSSIGTAVIRVIVEDPDNLIDDYLKYLGISIDDAAKDYDDLFEEIPFRDGFARSYYLLDEIIECVSFIFSLDGNITDIYADIRNGIDTSALQQSFAKKYPKNYPGDNCHYYDTEKKGKNATIIWNYDLNFISYQYKSDNGKNEDTEKEKNYYIEFYDFYKLLNTPLNDASSNFGKNYSDSYKTEVEKVGGTGTTMLGGGRKYIKGGIRHYPSNSFSESLTDKYTLYYDENEFNGYEEQYNYIKLEYIASGFFMVPDRWGIPRNLEIGNVTSVELQFLENTETPTITNTISQMFKYMKTTKEDDESTTGHFSVSEDIMVSWNPSKRILKYYINSSTQ